METPRGPSIGEILHQLLDDQLIDACHMTRESITVVKGGTRHRFAYRDARTFLAGMLRGRSWHGDGALTGLPASLQAIDRRHTAAEGGRPFGPALDDLLEMAEELQVIERYARDPSRSVVTISLAACETELSEGEALGFLAECILHKLTEMRRAPESATRAADGIDIAQDALTVGAAESRS